MDAKTTPKLSIDLADVLAARERLRDAIYYSPCPHSQMLSALTGQQVYLKLENLQMTGSFQGARRAEPDCDAHAGPGKPRRDRCECGQPRAGRGVTCSRCEALAWIAIGGKSGGAPPGDVGQRFGGAREFECRAVAAGGEGEARLLDGGGVDSRDGCVWR